MFIRRIRASHLLIVVILLSACSPSQPTESIASAPLVGPVIPVGESEVRDLSPTTEVVSNCGSGGGTVIKHPSMSVVTNYAVEWEVGGTTGVGVTIGEGVVPGGVNLSSALEGRYATQFDQGIQQTTAWELPAEPDTVVEYTLMWREVWQPGYVEIRLADESTIKANVRYRIGIQSDIVGKRVENCSGEPIATQVYPTTPPQTSVPTTPQAPDLPTPVTEGIARFEVQADIWKNGTGLSVAAGDSIHIEYLEGQWTGDSSQPGLTEGCGFTWDDPVSEHVWLFPPEQRGAALVGYIDNEPFFVGCRPIDIVASISGEVFLGMSDCLGCFWDNVGQLYVSISVNRQ